VILENHFIGEEGEQRMQAVGMSRNLVLLLRPSLRPCAAIPTISSGVNHLGAKRKTPSQEIVPALACFHKQAV